MRYLIIVVTAFALSAQAHAGDVQKQKWTLSSPPLTLAQANDGGISFSQSPARKISKPKLRLFCTVFVDCVSVVGGSDTCAAGSSALKSPRLVQAGTLTSTLSLCQDGFTPAVSDTTGDESAPERLLKLVWLPLGAFLVILLRILPRRNSPSKRRDKRHTD